MLLVTLAPIRSTWQYTRICFKIIPNEGFVFRDHAAQPTPTEKVWRSLRWRTCRPEIFWSNVIVNGSPNSFQGMLRQVTRYPIFDEGIRESAPSAPTHSWRRVDAGVDGDVDNHEGMWQVIPLCHFLRLECFTSVARGFESSHHANSEILHFRTGEIKLHSQSHLVAKISAVLAAIAWNQ
jgi:hypothetical protein